MPSDEEILAAIDYLDEAAIPDITMDKRTLETWKALLRDGGALESAEGTM